MPMFLSNSNPWPHNNNNRTSRIGVCGVWKGSISKNKICGDNNKEDI